MNFLDRPITIGDLLDAFMFVLLFPLSLLLYFPKTGVAMLFALLVFTIFTGR